MSLSISSNTSALFAQNALISSQRGIAFALEQLSTGVRINSAKDDAAGLAISQNMTSEIRGLDQVVRNINDGISLLQTAEGGLSSITDILQRMRELAVQSSTGTYSNEQRTYMQNESAALQLQIDNIGNSTTWNGAKILDGSFDSKNITIGENSNFNISLPSVKTSNMGMSGGATITTTTSVPTTTTSTTTVSSTTYGQFVVQFAYSGTTPVMFNARLNANTGQLLTSIDNSWASGTIETAKTSIRLSDFVYGGNGGPAGHGHITISPGGIIPNETVNIDYTGDVYPWNAIYIDYEYTDGVYKIKNVGSNSSGVRSIAATFNSGGTTATNPNYVPVTTTTTSTTYSNVTTTTVLPGLDISTSASAAASISVIDAAINKINNSRSLTGSYINSLNYASDNASNISFNLTKSRSAILDTDYAAATTELARNQIIQQAATAMLAHANQQPQFVLELLKNL